jgi:probable rRNA maturation factor
MSRGIDRLVIDVAIEVEAWSVLDAPEALARAVIAAAVEVAAVELAAAAEISIVLCGDAFIADLNRRWRGQHAPTNVLAFPSGADPMTAPMLGDIAIAYETAAREATTAAISLRDHVAHLLAHGFLHLVGYDHIEDTEAERMERLEGGILARLGIADPYGGSVALAAG